MTHPQRIVRLNTDYDFLGLFAGVSLEGTVLIERKDANRDFYGSMVPAKDILTGLVPPPEVASKMYEIIEVSTIPSPTWFFPWSLLVCRQRKV